MQGQPAALRGEPQRGDQGDGSSQGNPVARQQRITTGAHQPAGDQRGGATEISLSDIERQGQTCAAHRLRHQLDIGWVFGSGQQGHRQHQHQKSLGCQILLLSP